jgi:hypothetical protein
VESMSELLDELERVRDRQEKIIALLRKSNKAFWHRLFSQARSKQAEPVKLPVCGLCGYVGYSNIRRRCAG